jgi:hypothetical protein
VKICNNQAVKLCTDDIGQNRGVVATRLLLELNPEVRGDCVDEKPDQIISQRPDFFKV